MPNPMIPVGVLNRVRASIKFTDHSELNVSASYLAKEGVELVFQGNMTDFLPAMTGAVQSPQPYMIMQAKVHLLRSQALGRSTKPNGRPIQRSVMRKSTQTAAHSVILR